jgi:hypothetical protein
MAVRTISGNISIPASEPSTGGVYSDLTLQLVSITNDVETIEQTATVSINNNYSFEYVMMELIV